MAGKMGLTMQEYARHIGKSYQAVQKAIKSGRIEPLPDGSIDPDTADQQWIDNTDQRKVRASKTNDFISAQTLKAKAEATIWQIKARKELNAVVTLDEWEVFLRVLNTDLADNFMALGRSVAPRLVNKENAAVIAKIIDEAVIRLIKEFKHDIDDRLYHRTKEELDSRNNP